MAAGTTETTLRASDQRLIPQPGANPMHPFGTYLAITDNTRERAAIDRRVSFAKVDAEPLTGPESESEPVSRRTRLVATVRRHVMRTAGA